MFNAFGTGVADDKLAHAYVEEMVRFYLGEEPILPSVETFDLAEPDVRADALGRIEDLVIKQRTGSGGFGVDDRRARARARARGDRPRLRERRRGLHRAAARDAVDPPDRRSTGASAPSRRPPARSCLRRASRSCRRDPGGPTRVRSTRACWSSTRRRTVEAKDTWVLTVSVDR